MSLTTKLVLALTALVVLVGGIVAYTLHERQVGALNARIAALTATNAQLKGQEAKVESVYVRDTVRLTHTLTQWDTARVTDTVTVSGVVYVDRTVADSTIKACTITIRDCQAGWALARARADTLATLLGASKPKAPSFWSHFHATAGATGLVGLDDGKPHVGPGLTFGWTF